MRLFKGKIFNESLNKDSSNASKKKMNKKRCISIVTMVLSIVMFVMSGISSFADELALDENISGTIYKYVTFNKIVYNKVGTATTFDGNNTDNIPFVLVVKEDYGWVFNNSKATIWTPFQISTEQKASLVSNLYKCVMNTKKCDTFDSKRIDNYKTALAHYGRVEFVATSGTNITRALGEAQLVKTGSTIKVSGSTVENWIYGTFKKSETQVFPTCDIYGRPTSSTPATQAPATQAPATQAPATQAPTTQAPATQAPVTQAPTTQAPTIKDGYIKMTAAKLFDGKTSVKLTKNTEKPFLVSVDNGTVYVWTREALNDTQKENFTKVLNESFYTIPIAGQYDVINNAINSKKINYMHTVTRNADQLLGTTKKLSFKDSGEEVVISASKSNVDWYVTGYFVFADTKQTSIAIEDGRGSVATPAPVTQAPATQTPVVQTPVTPATQAPVVQTPVTQAPITGGETVTTPVAPDTQGGNSTIQEAPVQNGGSCGNDSSSCNDAGESQVDTTNTSNESEDISIENTTEESNTTGTAVTTDSSPKTGDASSVILFITLGIISLGVSIYLYYLSRKCEE